MSRPGDAIGKANLATVEEYFRLHLCATNRECSTAVGLSVEAVGRHVRTIRSKWTARDEQP